MDQAKLPTGSAHEPKEQAYQPPNTIDPIGKSITFAEDNVQGSPRSSERSNLYKDILSQPPTTLTHKQRMQWLQERRGLGLWVQCDSCDSWRHLPQALDSHDLPDKWYCSMNPDPNFANCFVPEVALQVRDEEDLIHAEYSAGSVVWARLPGWPWWPAMVDDCPDTEQFYWLDGLSDIPTHYNVVFFDAQEASRAWISPEHLKPFSQNIKRFNQQRKASKYKRRLDTAVRQAQDASSLSLTNRLAKYSFIAKFKGNILSPRKIDRRDLKKYQSALKRKFNIDFPIASDSNDDDDDDVNKNSKKTKKMKCVQKSQIMKGKKKNGVKNMTKLNSKRVEDKTENFHPDSEIQDSLTIVNGEPVDKIYKQPDSASVQVESATVETNVLENTSVIDNDSSATYVPDIQIQNESTVELKQTLEVRIASPSSDDFEF